MESVEHVDAIVIGGGPAGLSAAINLARARWTVRLFDRARPGRSDWAQINHNYLGFPEGITTVELGKRGRQQAVRYGARVSDCAVDALSKFDDAFEAVTDEGIVRSRGVVFATGVQDRWVTFPGSEEFIGRSMHWCIVCDGYEMIDQRVLVVGDDDEAAEVALQMLRFARSVQFLTSNPSLALPGRFGDELRDNGIRMHCGTIERAVARSRGCFESVVLSDGTRIELDHLFSCFGASPNSSLAKSLGVELNDQGFITVDTEAKTNVPGVVAAGDVTRLFAHQVATAVHEGATAAASLSYQFYLDYRARRRGGLAMVTS